MPGVGPIGEPIVAPPMPPLNYMDNDRIWTKEQALKAGVDMTKAKIHPEPFGHISSGTQTRGAGNVARWPGNTDGVEGRPYLLIPYRFTNGAHTSIAGSQQYISDSFDMITADVGGCIRFVDDSTDQAHSHWIDIQDSPTGGCVSYVGYLGGHPSFPNGQMLNLAPGQGPGTGGTCLASYVVNHEMLHALGFNHEQERADRDQHVTIHFDRIQEDKQHNFEKLTASEWFDMSSPYDGQSVMHYSAYSFQTAEADAADLPTITNLAGEPVQWPRVQRLSSTDVLQLAKMYEGFCGQPGGEFIKVRTCNSGAQYLESRACDGIADCADGSDEDAAFCDALCEPDTFYVTENGCNDSQDWTGTYAKMADGAYPKSLTISLVGGDASTGFDSGTFIRMDQADWCFDTPNIPSFKKVGAEKYIWPMPNGMWYMGSENCASFLNYYYSPSQNGGVANFWDIEAPVFNRWVGEWATSNNQRFKKGAEGWQNGNYILSMAADGAWSIADGSSSIPLGSNACVTGDHDGGIKVSELASSGSSCAGTTTTTSTLAPTTSFTTTDVTTTSTTTTTTPSISTTTTMSWEQCEATCQPNCDAEFGVGEKNCSCNLFDNTCMVCEAGFVFDFMSNACIFDDPCACDRVAPNLLTEKALWKWQMMKPYFRTNTASSFVISSSRAAALNDYQGYLIFSRKTCKQTVLNMFRGDDPEHAFSFEVMDMRDPKTDHPMPNYRAFNATYYQDYPKDQKDHRSITMGFNVHKTQPDITGNLKKDAYILQLNYPNGLPDTVTWNDIYDCVNFAIPVTIPMGPDKVAEFDIAPTCDYTTCVGQTIPVGF